MKMKQLKDYYKYFYPDRAPMLNPSIKRYEKGRSPNKRQCERYINYTNSGGYYQQPSINSLTNLQEISENIHVGYPSTVNARNRNSNVPNDVTRTYNGNVARCVEGHAYIPQGVPEYKFQPVHGYPRTENMNAEIEINSSYDNIDDTVEPMDLSGDVLYSSREQMQIFDGLTEDYTTEPERGASEGEALDLSTKQSPMPQNLHAFTPEVYVYDVNSCDNNSYVNSNLAPVVIQKNLNHRMPTKQPIAHRQWTWVAPPSRPMNGTTHRPETGSDASANKNSILFKILNEKAVFEMTNGSGLKSHLEPITAIPKRAFNLVPSPRPPPFHPSQFLRRNNQMTPCVGQQTPPSPDMYRNLPLSPTGSAHSGSLTPPSPRSPVNVSMVDLQSLTSPQQQPSRYRCPQRGIRYRKQISNNRPSLKSCILSEMGIQSIPGQSSSSAVNKGSKTPGSSSTGQSEPSRNATSANLLDIVTVQNVYVNYLRQMMRNPDDVKTVTNLSEEKAQFQLDNTRPNFISAGPTKEEEKPLPSDMMAILQAEVLKKSLCLKAEHSVSDCDLDAARKSSLETIYSLIEDEFNELKC